MKKLYALAILAFLLLTPSAWAACSNTAIGSFTCVQGVVVDNTGVNPVTVTFGAANTSGNFIALFILIPASQSITSVTGTNSYSVVAGTCSTGSQKLFIYYAMNIGSVTESISIQWTAAAGTLSAIAEEFSGVRTSSAFDTSACGTGNSASLLSASATPAGSGELALGFGRVDAGQSGSPTPSTGYTNLNEQPANHTYFTGGKSVSAATQAGWTVESGGSWAVLVALFKAPATATAAKRRVLVTP